jgi:pyruvate dehydrogenase E1 component
MKWAFDYMQRDGEGDPDERTWLRDETGGSVYLRLTTNPIEQPGKRPTRISGKARLTAPTGCASPGPIASGHRLPGRRGARSDPRRRAASPNIGAMSAVLAVTSADRLNAGWTAAQRARARGNAAPKAISRR